MRQKTFKVGALRRFIIASVLALCLVLVGSSSAFALSVDDYFSYSYTVELDKTELRGTELFYATVIVTAACTNDLPLAPSEASITGRIIAEHQATGTRQTLNSSYTVTLQPFPSTAGETAYTSKVVQLQFPQGSQAGTYSIVAELIEAKVKVLIWIDVTDYLPSSQTIGSVAQLRGGSGGGGGGGGGGFVAPPPPKPPPAPALPPGTSDVSGFISADGTFTATVVIESVDGKCWLTVNEGTTGLSGEGDPLATIAVTEMEDSLAPPEDFYIIGPAYNFGPEGATFASLVTLTITYDESLIPEGIVEEEFVIARWGEATEEWMVLAGCTVDPEANTITVPISNFSTFTILTPIPEAVFSTSELSVTPPEVYTGEGVTIGSLVTNVGNIAGSYKVGLRIDDALVTFRSVTLEAGASEVATFTIAKNIAGTYTVTIDDLSETLVVSVRPEPLELINWWLVGGITAGFIATIIVISLTFRHPRRKA
ncbi:MAG: hypothetical protein V3V43_01245 [Dehalococcoidales bacterium]